MELKDLIESIRPYFVNFNIIAEDGAQYVFVKFPTNWKIPDKDLLYKEFKVQVGSDNNGIYFVNEMSDGVESLFKTIIYCINLNKSIQEKAALYNQKIKELQEIFTNETLERLKKLEFTIKGKKIKKKEEEEKEKEEVISQNIEVEEVNIEEKKEVTKNETKQDDSLLSLAKNLAKGNKK